MRRLIGVALGITLCFRPEVASPAAQPRQLPRPNFAGTWALISQATDSPLVPLGRETTILQDDATITLSFFGRAMTALLDGREVTSTSTTVRGDVWSHIADARWITAALLLTSKTNGGGGAWADAVLLTFDGDQVLNIVTLGTPTTVASPQPSMILRIDKYRRK